VVATKDQQALIAADAASAIEHAGKTPLGAMGGRMDCSRERLRPGLHVRSRGGDRYSFRSSRLDHPEAKIRARGTPVSAGQADIT